MGRALVPDLLPAFNHWMPSRSSAPTLLYGRKTVPAFSPTDPPAALSSPPYRTVHSDDMIARHTQAHRVGNPLHHHSRPGSRKLTKGYVGHITAL